MKDKKKQVKGIGELSRHFLSNQESSREKVTIREAAKALNVTRGKIITYLNQEILTRIKENDQVYILTDEIRALSESIKKLDVSTSVDNSRESEARTDFVTSLKDHHKKLLANLKRPENERNNISEYEIALQAKDTELESLKSKFNSLKRKLETQASELERAKARLQEMEKDQQEQPVDFKSTANANNLVLLKRTKARLLATEENLKRLSRPRWKELFGHPWLRADSSGKKGMALFVTCALLAGLIFSVWWFNRSPKKAASPVNEGQASKYGTVRSTSQAVLDSDLKQEESIAVNQPSWSLQNRVTPELGPATLNAQISHSYPSNFEGVASSKKGVYPLPKAEQQVVGLSSTPPSYILRAETVAPTWLHMVIDEKQEHEYLLNPSESLTWGAMSGFRLHIGNAAGLRLYLNDQPLKPLGADGAVVHIQLPDPSLIMTSSSEDTEPANKQLPQ